MSQGSDVVATLGYGTKSSWGFNKNCESLESVNQNMKDVDYLITNIAPTGGTTKFVRTRLGHKSPGCFAVNLVSWWSLVK
jgi:hypothetical protein